MNELNDPFPVNFHEYESLSFHGGNTNVSLSQNASRCDVISSWIQTFCGTELLCVTSAWPHSWAPQAALLETERLTINNKMPQNHLLLTPNTSQWRSRSHLTPHFTLLWSIMLLHVRHYDIWAPRAFSNHQNQHNLARWITPPPTSHAVFCSTGLFTFLLANYLPLSPACLGAGRSVIGRISAIL